MRAWIAVTFGVVASLTFASFDAHACGESLFRVGRGVAYRPQTVPLPGNILVVARSKEAKDLADKLASRGHKVHVVAAPALVAQEIRSAKYDVVLAPFDDREQIAAETAGVDKPPAYVPVTTEASQKPLAKQAYPRYLSTDDDFTQFLRVLNRTLKDTPNP